MYFALPERQAYTAKDLDLFDAYPEVFNDQLLAHFLIRFNSVLRRFLGHAAGRSFCRLSAAAAGDAGKGLSAGSAGNLMRLCEES
jgi:predicted TPR repeat methyltransferase